MRKIIVSRTPLSTMFMLAMIAAVPLVATAQPVIGPRLVSDRKLTSPAEREEQETRQAPQKNLAPPPASRVLKLDTQTLKKLDNLPKDQPLEIAGERMTVGEYRARALRENKKAAARLKSRSASRSASSSPDLAALQAKLDQSEEADLRSANAKVLSHLAKLKEAEAAHPTAPERDAIRKEAAKIQGRILDGTATPREAQRARELFEEYQRLQ